MGEQLALDLRAGFFRREDYVEGPCNAAARAALGQWRRWPNGALALIGPKQSGKSHLADIWREGAEGHTIDSALMNGLDAADVAALVARPLVIDPAIAPINEVALFHLLNLAREGAGPVMIVTERSPRSWPVVMPDLASRLAAITETFLAPPDEIVLAGVLQGACRQRFIDITDKVARFAASRLDGFDKARAFAARIDAAIGPNRRQAGLAAVRRVLGEVGRLGDADA